MFKDDVENRAAKHFVSKKYGLDRIVSTRTKKAMNIIDVLRPFVLDKNIDSALSIGSSHCLIEEEVQRALFPNAKFFCTDLDKKALDQFQQPQLTKIVKSATDLDFPDESFDFIMAHQVLEHINNHLSILQTFRRICKPGGIIFISVPNPFSPMFGKLPTGEWPKPFFKRFISHNTRKLKRDFMENTEKYHTGFSERYLRSVMNDFSIFDLRKPRLKQEFNRPLARVAIDLIPSPLLSIPIGTNIWCLIKDKEPA